jgi:PAS domain S-box-containing protein
MVWTALRLDSFEGGPAILAIGRNVSVQQAAREAIQEREARLQAIFDAAVDGIITTNERGIIESVNPTAELIFGYDADELMGKNVDVLMPSPYREEHGRFIGNYLDTGQKRIIGIGREVEGLRKDGTTFPMELGVSEVQTDERRIFTGIVRDITERKRTQEQLLQAERLAAIGEMVAGLAHESRNAFQRSKASLELLEMEVGDQEDAVALVQQIQRAQDHIYHLYEEVRNFAAPINLKCQPCDLAHVWRRIWNDLDVNRDGKEVSLREQCSAIGLTCYADAVSLGQVFRNIFENAIEACPNPGEISIDCDDVRLHGRAALRIRLTDNGPGLAAESRNRIFEPFFTTKTKGTGLGMAIARRIVQAHGGKIAVGEPRGEGWGASIELTLPREKI